MQSSRSSLSPIVVTTLFALMLSACGNNQVMRETEDDGSTVPIQSSSSKATMPASEAAVVPKQTYADGTFAAAGNYNSPAGMEEINVSLTLKKGMIAAATFQGTATNPRSVKFQGLFDQGFQEAVVGKPIDSLDLTVVNGSSLTPIGFMDALEKIKEEAKV